MNKKFLSIITVLILTGCSNEATRLSECEAKGVSRDACYIAEQNRQAAINGSAEKQALENAKNLYPQKAQATKGGVSFTKRLDGMTIKRDGSGNVLVNGKPATKDEVTADAITYVQGNYIVIVYKSGKVAVMENRVFKGYAK